MVKICCVGAGYVGGPTMAMIALKCPNIKVTVCDISQRQIDAWNSDSLPIYEPGLDEIVFKVRGKNMFFTTDIAAATDEADIIFVSVNTNTKRAGHGAGRAADLTNWELAGRSIAQAATTNKIIVEKSTVPVRTAETLKRVLYASRRSKEVRFDILSSPEFLAEGTAIRDLSSPDRVLIGGEQTAEGKKAIRALAEVYEHWVAPERIITTNLWSSELTKLTANAFLAQRVSSINAISALCEATGADVDEVATAVGSDSRIGPKFLKASIGFGGSCFQKDIYSLVYICESFGLQEVAEYWSQVIKMNNYQKERFVRRMLHEMFDTVSGKKIAILGYAFKKDTGDTRESPAIYVMKQLLEERAKVTVFDPKVNREQVMRSWNETFGEEMPAKYQDLVTCADTAYDACKESHAITVMTEWEQFKTLDYAAIFDTMVKPAFLFDGRNILDHASLRKVGYDVFAIGKKISDEE